MKNFEEIRFPSDISYGSSGGPEYSTDIITTSSGHESRNVNWSYGKVRYNVAQGIRTAQQLEKLICFFRARKGKAIGFRFKDWSDYKVREQLIGYGDGNNTKFQFIKTYQSGTFSEKRTILKPVKDTVTIYLDDEVVKEDLLEIDYIIGVINFKIAPSNKQRITADFEFDIPARFDTDHLPALMESYGLYSCNNITIVEIKPQ